MIKKLAIYVCPLPGCPKIAMAQGKRCPEHDKLMVREIYVHQGIAPGLGGPRKDPLGDLMRDVLGGDLPGGR